MSEAVEAVDIAGNLARIRDRIAGAAERAGRSPDEVRLVAVAKTVRAEMVSEAIAAGIADIGENYVQEAAAKKAEVSGDARWHMVGHLQRNKVSQALAIFDMIQTVDSRRLGEAISRRAEAAGRTMEVLVQVNTSGEGSKFGVTPDGAEALLRAAMEMPGIHVTGLMTIGGWDPDPERARPEFRLLAGLAADLEAQTGLEMRWLSMGMSHDFEVAIEEGGNLLRIGTGIFGPRPD
jgi:pyridoxal phosphate enzyme (YggS family)